MGIDFDVVCLSHLRWDFVFQRPQHLLTRCARTHRVFFVEEPVFADSDAHMTVSLRSAGITVAVPHLPTGTLGEDVDRLQQQLLKDLFRDNDIENVVLWFYTPMAVSFTDWIRPLAIVYDCMDELSAFRGAPKILRDREKELFEAANLVFTGGQSLYEAKKDLHTAVYAFPSSVDVDHFAAARDKLTEPSDQAGISHPRVGFYGVIDERLDLDLVAEAAAARSDLQWILIGPVVKIDPSTLPRAENIHYLGPKKYDELPQYLAGWDVAMMPFARNEATRFISPTKTPEYLAAGKPVVSTSIKDVVSPYGHLKLAYIADTPEQFVAAVDAALTDDSTSRCEQGRQFLSANSWNKTWSRMEALIEEAITQTKYNEKEHYNV